ncbi:MAG TPA: DUF4124 domain-containing protein [Syntrophales bacterium]|nr:DUF4124 domain-containing protein [Syntrophales bacterium]
MSTDKLRNSIKVMLFVMIIFTWLIASGALSEGAMYKYTDKDGTVVITDSPPPDLKIDTDELPASVAQEQKLQVEKEKQSGQKINQKRDDTYDNQRQARIAKAKGELDRALADEENYRLNLQQASTIPDRVRWRELLDKQQKVIQEKREKLRDVESQP